MPRILSKFHFVIYPGNRCLEPNCGLINPSSQWRSSVKDETDFFAVWKSYQCDLLEFTTSQLQQCVTDRKIIKFEHVGTSIAQYVSEFVNHRLSGVELYNDVNDPDGLTIKYDTLALLHKAHSPSGLFESQLPSILKDVPKSEEHYWIAGMYLSSEREVHAHVNRMDEFNRNIRPIIEPMGYKTINVFDLTAGTFFLYV